MVSYRDGGQREECYGYTCNGFHGFAVILQDVTVMLSNHIEGLKVGQHQVGEFAISPFSYEADDILHPLLQAGRAQFPSFELHSFLSKHLAGQAHGRHGILALGRLLQKLLMKLLQVGCC